LRSLLPGAVDALEREIQSGKNGWRAALEVLRLVGLDRSGKKNSLGYYLIGQTDPDSIVDALARAKRPDPLDKFLNGEPVSETERLAVLAELEREIAA
jgi:hypothetical protein